VCLSKKEALFTMAKIWKQPKFSSVDECIKKMWQIHTKEYLTLKKEGNSQYVTVSLTLRILAYMK